MKIVSIHSLKGHYRLCLVLTFVVVTILTTLWWSARKPMIDVGLIPLTEVRLIQIPLINEAKSPLRLIELRPTCTCVAVVSFPLLVPPGQTLYASVLVRPEKIGPLRAKLEMLQEGKNGVTEVTSIKGTVRAPHQESLAFKASSEDRIQAPLLLTRLNEENRPLVVDVREASAFARAHIPRSLNIPVQALEKMAHAHEREVVLVDDGLSQEKTLEILRELKGKSFSRVRMLEGGLPAWRAIGGDLSSDGDVFKEVNILTAASVFEKVARQEASLLFVGNRPELAERWWADAARLKVSGEGKNDADKILVMAKKLVLKTKKPVIIASIQGEFYRTVSAALSDELKSSIFFLDGGANAYAEYIGQSQHHWMMANLGTQLEALGVRAVASARTAMRRGCSTCP
jgi:rhodanese-related sulfurtransferase